VIEVQPGDDPGPEKLKQLTDKCLAEKIKLIAIEPQYSPKAAESIEKEVENKAKKLAEKDKTYKDFKIKLIEIDPLETVKDKDELTRDLYVETMQKNLELLKKELE
jgi:ABC-type Zn uptake system ZnuABC Zn-binding protein ZnuA